MMIVRCGFDGKLPSRGDFVGWGLPRSFLGPWQAWVQAALVSSRLALGEDWLPAWLEAPIWRFALPAGACGPEAALGLTMPSIDRGGRHYPLTVAAVFAGRQFAPAGKDWLDAVELLARDALALDHPPEVLVKALGAVQGPPDEDGPAGWWTEGSPRVPPTKLALASLPAAGHFAEMLDAGKVV